MKVMKKNPPSAERTDQFPVVLLPQLPLPQKVHQRRLRHWLYVCDGENSRNLENEECYHIERSDCFDYPGNDNDSLAV
jgi:hypothetical protein